MSRLRVTIDRIVFRGLDGQDRNAIVESIRDELSRVLSDREARLGWARLHRTPVLRLGRMPLGDGPSAARTFGGGLARAIGRGLKP